MHRMLLLAILAALLLRTVLGAVCEGLLEQSEQKLVTVDAVCKNQTLTLSWNRDASARPTPYHIECKNGTRTVFTDAPLDESFVLSPSGTIDMSSSIFQWPVQCTVQICYSNLNLRTSFSVLPTTCSFPNPSVFFVSSTASFPPSTKTIPTTIDWKASIASPLNPGSATTALITNQSSVNEQSITEIAATAPSITLTTSMMTNEQSIISSPSLHSISTKIAATATGTSVTMLTTLPSTDAMQQTVNGDMFGGATTTHALSLSNNTTVIQMPSNVGDTGENLSLSVSISIAIPVTIIILAIIIIISLCWMVIKLFKKIKKQDDYTNAALQDYNPVILSLARPYICGSTVTLTCPLEKQTDYFIHQLAPPPPTCATPNALISEEQAGSELECTLEDIKIIISQEEPSQPPWDHSGISYTDVRSDISSQESSHTQGYIYNFRRHSYESLAYIHQSDYIDPSCIDNIISQSHVSTN